MGAMVDETYRRDPADGFLSYYDETKWRAHGRRGDADRGRSADRHRPARAVYGPGDHSAIGRQLHQAYLGTAAFIALGSTGISPVHVDDLAAGILAALDRGQARSGRTSLAAPNVRLKTAMAHRGAGRRPRPAAARRPELVPPLRAHGIGPEPRAACSASRRTCARSDRVGRRHVLGELRQGRRRTRLSATGPASGFADAYGGDPARA